MRTTVRTVTGKSLDLINPDPAQICIEDIAHQLAQLNRYNGACPFPYSVGQHSLLVAAILPPHLQLWGLLHDAAEVYLGDLVSPAKRIPALGQVFKPLEHRIQDAICIRFGLDPAQDYTPIKEADDAVMAVEMAHLNGWPDLVAVDRLPRPGHIVIREMHWRDVEAEFLAKFSVLEDLGDALVAEQRLESIAVGTSRTFSLDEVAERLEIVLPQLATKE